MAREFLLPFALCAAGFTVMLLSGILFDLTDLILVRRVPAGTVGRLLAYKLPGVAVVSLPISALFASLLSLGRLGRDGELWVMRGCGQPVIRLLLPVVLAGAAVSVAAYGLNEYVVPQANHRFEETVRRLLLRDALPAVEANVFLRGPGERIFYVGEVDRAKRQLRRILIYELGQGPYPRLITARRGTYRDAVWVLEDGVTRVIGADGYVVQEVGFKRLTYPVAPGSEPLLGEQKTTEEMSRSELRQQISLFRQSGVRVKAFEVDYHLKLAMPLSALVFCLLGAPLALRAARSGRAFGVAASIGLAFVYFTLTAVCRSLAANGALPPLAGAWAPNLLFAALGVGLVWQNERP